MRRRGAGAFGGGIGPAGLDPLVTTKRIVPVLPAADRYDPLTRTFPYDSAGLVEASHPVDQAVALALTVQLGSLPYAPELGFDFERVQLAPLGTRVAVLNDCVQASLRNILARGDIAYLGTTVVENEPSRLSWEVAYVNLRLPNAQRSTVTVTG